MSEEKLLLVQGEKGMELPRDGENWVILKDLGYSPVQSLVAAVGSCGAYVYQSILEKSRIPYRFDKVEIDYVRDEEKETEPVKEITLVFFVEVEESKQGRAERGLAMVSKYCPVMQSIDPNIVVTEKVVFI